MRKMKGEILIGLAVVMFMWGTFAAIVVPDAYYHANKSELCPDDRAETTKSQREVCYVEKDAHEIGKKLVDK